MRRRCGEFSGAIRIGMVHRDPNCTYMQPGPHSFPFTFDHRLLRTNLFRMVDRCRTCWPLAGRQPAYMRWRPRPQEFRLLAYEQKLLKGLAPLKPKRRRRRLDRPILLD
jgi:hypothetical protein